jgi:hypothetical protein
MFLSMFMAMLNAMKIDMSTMSMSSSCCTKMKIDIDMDMDTGRDVVTDIQRF